MHTLVRPIHIRNITIFPTLYQKHLDINMCGYVPHIPLHSSNIDLQTFFQMTIILAFSHGLFWCDFLLYFFQKSRCKNWTCLIDSLMIEYLQNWEIFRDDRHIVKWPHDRLLWLDHIFTWIKKGWWLIHWIKTKKKKWFKSIKSFWQCDYYI